MVVFILVRCIGPSILGGFPYIDVRIVTRVAVRSHMLRHWCSFALADKDVEQGAYDASPEIAGGRGWIGDLPAGEPELHLGHLAGILELDHAAAASEAAGNGFSEGQELLEEGIGLGWGAGHGLIA